jgi:hypothetical protein
VADEGAVVLLVELRLLSVLDVVPLVAPADPPLPVPVAVVEDADRPLEPALLAPLSPMELQALRPTMAKAMAASLMEVIVRVPELQAAVRHPVTNWRPSTSVPRLRA